MLRDTGQNWSGDGGGSAGGEAGDVGCGVRAEEWSERFFYLCGHFLRYKKQSRNLTSVNLKQVSGEGGRGGGGGGARLCLFSFMLLFSRVSELRCMMVMLFSDGTWTSRYIWEAPTGPFSLS